MLEQLLIFTRGGLILWSCKEMGNALKGSPIDALIRSCLLEERAGQQAFQYDGSGASYTLKWTFHNEFHLVFVAVYQRFLNLLYVDELLSMVKKEFAVIFSPKKTRYQYQGEFDDTFRQLLKAAEAKSQDLRMLKQLDPVNKGLNQSLKGQGNKPSTRTQGKENAPGDADADDEDGKIRVLAQEIEGRKVNGVGIGVDTNGDGGNNASEVAFDVSKLQKLRSKGDKKSGLSKNLKSDTSRKNTKKNRVWEDVPSVTKLDFTDPSDQQGEAKVVIPADQGKSLMDTDESEEAGDSDSDEEAGNANELPSKKKSWFSSVFQSVAGKSAIERLDLEPALKVFKERLMTKNVAEEIAEKLCDSVAVSLLGKKQGSFVRISSIVQGAMEDALVRILTPKRSIDILRDVHAAKEQGRPYVIVFVGVNGVGKSTNLAKVAYWLLQHDISVMMAACDTFRSGAVEQLRTHARRLQIPIFEKGYEKDPAAVAKEAIAEAIRTKQDVVLVDTAGRMQDNEPLMRALSRLINVNRPDTVVFVGEALVGNDAVDQLSKFNQKLADLSTSGNSQLIDGILLTKFDTIDDKVGAALSMVYVSGAPIIFVGCGQTYTDLKKLNIKSIIKSLLK